jgi:hypothetical protein
MRAETDGVLQAKSPLFFSDFNKTEKFDKF